MACTCMLYYQMKVNAGTRRTIWLMVSKFYCAVQSEYRTTILQQKLQVQTLNSHHSRHVGFLLLLAKVREGGEHNRHYLTLNISCRHFQKRLANLKMSCEMLVHAYLLSTCTSTCQVTANVYTDFPAFWELRPKNIYRHVFDVSYGVTLI